MTQDQSDDRRTFVIAVATAACTAFATALATWAVDELRMKFGYWKKTAPPKEES